MPEVYVIRLWRLSLCFTSFPTKEDVIKVLEEMADEPSFRGRGMVYWINFLKIMTEPWLVEVPGTNLWQVDLPPYDSIRIEKLQVWNISNSIQINL